jgi:tetratricopeptide (TPR) repeat protein
LSILVPPPGLIAESSPPPLPAHQAASPSFGDPFAAAVNSSPAPKTVLPNPATLAAASPASIPGQVSPILPKPTPVEEIQVAPPQSRLDGLLAEAAALRQRGDMSTAITRLREALATSPKNPQVMTELAETYEKMDLGDKALEQYRDILDLGPVTGIYYELADAKLKAADQHGTAQASPGGDDSALPAGDGFQQGSVLALVNLSTDEKPETSEGYKRFTLKIPVKRRADVKIDVPSVVIQVFLYDQLGDQSIVRTNAIPRPHWANLPADWVQDDIEILEVDYTQAPPEPGKIEEGRHYYGYVVCVYYNKQLQDEASDPVSLIKTNPPPLKLPEK